MMPARILLSVFLLFAACDKKSGDLTVADRGPVAEVESELAETRDLSNSSEGFGVIAPGNSSTLNVSLPRPIVISKLLVVPGQAVNKGQALFESVTESSGRLSFRQAVIAQKAAKLEYERLSNLLSKQLSTASQVAAAEKAMGDANELLKSEVNMGNGSDSYTFKSPFDGIVASIPVTQGDHLQAGSPVLQISAGDSAQLNIGLEPKIAKGIKGGMPVEVVGAIDEGITAEGKVKSVSLAVNPITQFVDVWIDLPINPFPIGTKVYGRVQFLSKKALSVPRNSVLFEDGKAKIFTIKDLKASESDVETGMVTADYIEIIKGINPGDKVIKAGNYVLEDGMVIKEVAP